MAVLLAQALKPSLSINRELDNMSRPSLPIVPLCQLPAGSIGRVREVTGGADFCQRVREMGFGESAFVTKIGGTGPFICQVNGTRLALSHGAAMHILVEVSAARKPS
jgi:ferrous iron transport protein A